MSLTVVQVRELPPTVDLMAAACVLGICRTKAYELARADGFAVHFGRKERWGRLVEQQGQRQDTNTGLPGVGGPAVALGDDGVTSSTNTGSRCY